MSGGGIETVVNNSADPGTKVLAQAFLGNQKRDVVVQRQEKEWNGGMVTYLRGTNSATYRGGHLLTPDNPDKWFNGSSLLRYSLDNMGYSIHFDKLKAGLKTRSTVFPDVIMHSTFQDLRLTRQLSSSGCSHRELRFLPDMKRS